MSVCLVAIGAALYVTMVTCRHHFFKVEFAIFRAILSFTILQFYAQRCNCKLSSRQAVPTVNSAENAIAAGGSTRTPLGELTTLPRPPSRLGSRHPIPHLTRCLWRLDARVFGASIAVPPLTQNPGDATGHHHFLRQSCASAGGIDVC